MTLRRLVLIITMGWLFTPIKMQASDLEAVIQMLGEKSSCYFVIEQCNDRPLLSLNVSFPEKSGGNAISDFIKAIPSSHAQFSISPVVGAKNIYVIRDRRLIGVRDPLDQTLDSFEYKGYLRWLPAALGRKVPGISSPGITYDAVVNKMALDGTSVDIKARDESARNILLNAIPKAAQKRLLLCATYEKDLKVTIEVY